MKYEQDGNVFVGQNGELFVLKNYQKIREKDYELSKVLLFPTKFPELDIEATKVLSQEVPPRHINIDKDEYINELNKPFPNIKIGSDKVLLNNFPEISDAFISEFAQKAGLQFRREDVYNHAQFNEKTQKIDYLNEKGQEVEIPSVGSFIDNEITIVNEIISLNKEDYKTAQKNEAAIKALEAAEPELTYWEAKEKIFSQLSLKEQKLYDVYERGKNKEHEIKKTLLHEIKHFKNNFLLESRQYKDDYKNLSIKNLFNRCIDDERSATFEEMLYEVNTYLEQGKDDDYSMFSQESKFIVKKLKSINNQEEKSTEAKREEIIKILTNSAKLMSLNYIQWTKHLEEYAEEFNNIVREDVEKMPYLRETETANEEYFKQRSIIYSYRVYNPETKKYEYQDLSKMLYSQNNGKSEKVDVRTHPEALADYINVDKRFQKEINDINKILKLKRVRESLSYKKFDKGILYQGKKLSKQWFRKSYASQKAEYLKKEVYSKVQDLLAKEER